MLTLTPHSLYINFNPSTSHFPAFPRNPSIDISRERLNEARFEAGFSPVPKSRALRARLISALPPEPIRTALTPPLTLMAWFQFLLNHVPIIRWLWSYQAKFVINDIVSGVTVSIMHIPQGSVCMYTLCTFIYISSCFVSGCVHVFISIFFSLIYCVVWYK